MTRLVIIPLALLMLGCGASGSEAPIPAPTEASAPPIAATLGEVVTLRRGESARIAAESLTLAFHAVGIDSRCPTDVNCVWEGNAEIGIEIEKAGHPAARLELNTSPCAPCLGKPTGTEPRRASYLGYDVELHALAPERTSDVPIAQRDYVASLIVTRR